MQVEKKRIAFIFIEEIHHLYHFISIAIELSKYENVHILTFPHQDHLLEQTLENLGGHKVKVERRSTKLFRAITFKFNGFDDISVAVSKDCPNSFKILNQIQ